MIGVYWSDNDVVDYWYDEMGILIFEKTDPIVNVTGIVLPHS